MAAADRYRDDYYDPRLSARERDWERRFADSCRGRTGFAWGAFLIGLVVGAIVF